MSNVILAIAEQTDGLFRKVTHEILSEGKKIAAANGLELAAVVLGSGVDASAESLKQFGADRIIVADKPELSDYAGTTYVEVLSALIEKEVPSTLV